MTRYAQVPELKRGVVFSDPWYGDDVWCQYRKDFHAENWLMSLESKTADGILSFQLKLGRPTMSAGVQFKPAGDQYRVSIPNRYEMESVELGIDTAKIFCGSKEHWDTSKEEASIHTGTDGLFGDLYIFTSQGEQDPAGFVVLGSIDADFIDHDELFRHFAASFGGREINRSMYEKLTSSNSIDYLVCTAAEARAAAGKQASPDGKDDHEPER